MAAHTDFGMAGLVHPFCAYDTIACIVKYVIINVSQILYQTVPIVLLNKNLSYYIIQSIMCI